MRSFDWDALRSMWLDHTDRAVAHASTRHPDETFYVLVFMLEDLHGPTLAMQSFEGMRIRADERRGEFSQRQWSPFEWGERDAMAIPGADDENIRLYRALQDHARSGTRTHERAVHARHQALIIEVAGVVAARARDGHGAFAELRKADDFVVFAREHDVRRPFETARLTMTRDVQERFFGAELEAEKARAAVGAMPEHERVAYLVLRLAESDGVIGSEEAREQLAAIGEPAVDAVAPLLADPRLGWIAASVLCTMGPRAAAAAPVLLATARGRGPVAAWAARALGAMGRIDALVTLADPDVTATGLVRARPDSYEALATLAASGDAGSRAVSRHLAPGSAAYDARPEDFSIVAAHARSPHDAIRKDVAIALGTGEWTQEDAARAATLLIAMLEDEDSEVRRLAALAAQWRGHEARAVLPALGIAAADRVKNVADTAAHAIAEIEADLARRA